MKDCPGVGSGSGVGLGAGGRTVPVLDAGLDAGVDAPAMFLQNRARMAATCARVALPFGSSLLPEPLISPSALAHFMAASA